MKHQLTKGSNLGKQRKLILVAIVILLSIIIGGNIRDYNRQKEAELNQIRLESEQLQQAKDKLERELEKTKTENEKLRKDLQSKLRVRVASRVKVSAEQWRPLVAKYFPASQVETAMRVMSCESGGNPAAINWDDAKITGMPSNGLFQINSYHNWSWSDPETNIQRAHNMWVRRGWQPWSCFYKI